MKQYKEGIVFASGCEQRKCPCRKWISCSRYNSKVWQDLHPEELNIDLHNWYDIHFRINYQYPDILGNG